MCVLCSRASVYYKYVHHITSSQAKACRSGKGSLEEGHQIVSTESWVRFFSWLSSLNEFFSLPRRFFPLRWSSWCWAFGARRHDAGLAWALGATQQEGEGTRKKKTRGWGPERQKQARPLFCSKFFTTVKKMLRLARMVFLG